MNLGQAPWLQLAECMSPSRVEDWAFEDTIGGKLRGYSLQQSFILLGAMKSTAFCYNAPRMPCTSRLKGKHVHDPVIYCLKALSYVLGWVTWYAQAWSKLLFVERNLQLDRPLGI